VFIEDFALVSDSAYVAQNAGRIIRALLEIAISRNWANCAFLLIGLSKAIERRMWPYEHPLQQMSLQRDTLYNLRRWADDTEISELRDMDAKSLGEMVHLNEHHGKALHTAATEFPTVSAQYALRPLANDLLEIAVTVEPTFKWSQKVSGSAEPFYVWVQDADGTNILQWRSVLLRQSTKSVVLEFVIPWTADTHASLSIVTVSDKWLGSDSQTYVDLSNLVMPRPFDDHTPLLDLPFLTLAALDDAELAEAYRPVSMLNGLQSQAFWSVYHTQHNVLVSAPVASGKSLLGEIALWHAFRHAPSALCIVVVPHFRAAAEAAARIRGVVPKNRGVRVNHVRSSEALESAIGVNGGRIIVATPSAFDGIARERLRQLALGDLSTVVFEDIHLLDAVYELAATKILSVARPARVRIVGLTASLSDPSDVANWLGVEEQFRFNFFPRDRGSPVVVHLKTFTTPHSATLLKTMVKPVYDIVKEAQGNVIIFVPSRASCRIVARDLVTQSGTAMDLNGFLNAQRADVEPLVAGVEPGLEEPLLHGIGYIVPTMRGADVARVLELFAAGIVKALIAPHEACWTLPVRASSVVLMGAQYTHVAGDERVTTNYNRHELVKMQAFAVASAHPAAPGGRMHVLCQSEQQTAISRLLSDGLPLESSLPAIFKREASQAITVGGGSTAEAVRVLDTMFNARPAPPPPVLHRPRVPDLRKRDAMDMLGWTLLGRRVRANPTFYGVMEGAEAEGLSRLVDEWFVPPPQPKVDKKKEKKVEQVEETPPVAGPLAIEEQE
jgi:antiviral helicase SLH1